MSKNSIQKFLVSCFFIAIIFSCSNLTTPKRVKIQADPEFNVSLGKIDASFTDYFSLKDILGESKDFPIYEYKHNEEDDTLRFLAKFDFAMEIPGLDLESHLKDLEIMDPISFGYEGDGVTPSVLFSIPEINEKIEIDPITLNFADEITDSIKDLSAISFKGLQPGLIQKLENQNIPCLLELCDDEFDSITFGEGTSLDIGFNQITDASVTSAKINKIAIFNANKFIDRSIKDFKEDGESLSIVNLLNINTDGALVEKEINADLLAGQNLNVSIDLSNVTLPKDVCFILFVSLEGGDDSRAVSITTRNSKFSNVSFIRITGFNTTDPIIVDFPEISPINLTDGINGLKCATIGKDSTDGEVKFSFGNLPEGVSYITKISLLQSTTEYKSVEYSGLNIDNQVVENERISLSNKNLNTNPINFTGNLEIEAVDADIDFTKEIPVTAEIKINKFDSVILEDSVIPKDIAAQTFSFSLGDIADHINKITFNEVGLDLKLCNGLPFDATMKVTSKFLGKSDESYHFMGNQTNLSDEAIKIISGTKENPLEINIDSSTEFDLSIDLSIPSSNGVITIPNVVTGSEYKFYGQGELIIDWESVNFKLSDSFSGFKGSLPGDGEIPFDFSMFTNIFGNDLCISGIEPKLYLSSDLLSERGPLAGSNLQVEMKATYTHDGEKKIKDLTVSENKQLKMVSFPDLQPNEDFMVIGELPTPSMEISSEALTDVFFSGANDISFDYNFGLSGSSSEGDLSSGIEIKKSALSSLGKSSEIKVGLFIDLPINLTVKPNEKGYASIDFISMFNNGLSGEEGEEILPEKDVKESDMFNRGEGDDLGAIADVFDFVEQASLNINYTNNTGISLSLVILDENENGEIFSKEITLGKGSGTMDISFTKKDAEYIQNTNPFYPDSLEIRFPGSKTEYTSYEINRNLGLDFTLQASVKTDIDYTLDLTNSEGEN